MIAAMRVARRMGRADAATEGRLTALLATLGLPTDLDGHAGPEVLRYVGADKKRLAERVAFIVPGPPGRVEAVPLALGELEGLVFSAIS